VQRIVLFALFLSSILHAQQDTLLHTLFFTGDTGKDTIPSEALFLLAFEAIDNPKSSVVLLGDNIYPAGIEKGRDKARSERILTAQLELFSTYRGNLNIIPGNHDWSAGKASGLKAVKQQAELANAFTTGNSILKNSGTVYFAKPGSPGPEMRELHPQVSLILLDTQWWLQHGVLRKVDHDEKSIQETAAAALEELDKLLSEAEQQKKFVVVAGHHPVFTNGKHGHRKEPFRFLFTYTPLRLLGLFGLDRYFAQDIHQPRYNRLRRELRKILSKHPQTIYVSGHEHNMQYFSDQQAHYFVSGSGAKLSPILRYRYPAHFMDDQQTGFFKLMFYASGKAEVQAFGVRDRGEFWSKVLFYK
jgi:hypothetical protein